MKKFLLRLLYFAVPFFIYIVIVLFVLPPLIEKTEGPGTELQIQNSFNNAKSRNYDLLILGNSGTYRGINPDMMSIPAYNFSHDNDTYNQIYYKLIWLEQQNKKFKYVILGLDYFQFSFISDTRNYAYFPLFGDEYMKDYPSSNFIRLFIKKKNLLEFTRLKYLANIFKERQHTIIQKENGQYIKPGKASENDEYFYSIERLPVQEKYFDMILDYCAKNGIEVFLSMSPVRKNALVNYTDSGIKEFQEYILAHTNDKVHLLDYSHQPGWSVEDYTDISHLNEAAADRFSKQLNDTITHIIKEKNK